MDSDVLLAALLPLSCLFMLALFRRPAVTLRSILDVVRGPAKHAPRQGHFSLERATCSYDGYLDSALRELSAMRKSYQKLGRAHKHVGYRLGYPAKLDKLAEVLHVNAALTTAIASFAREQFPALKRHTGSSAEHGDLSRVREALRHFVRDWSTEGQPEREVIFRPILDVLEQVPQNRRKGIKVLVPGSGLGRLAWETSKLGFHTTAIELSYFMTLAFRFLLSPSTTREREQHTLHPYATWFSHQRSNDNTFRAISFPDEVPRLGADTLALQEGDFLEHFPPSGYDFVVTLFFIDTSLNVIETVEHIRAVLRPGGKWINLGPLLWPPGGQTRLELSLGEVLALVEGSGFRLEDGDPDPATKRRTVVCEYTADPRAMMQWMYHAEFWVATKLDTFASE